MFAYECNNNSYSCEYSTIPSKGKNSMLISSVFFYEFITCRIQFETQRFNIHI